MATRTQESTALMEGITDALERHGYLPRMRAGLKVVSLKTAQDMVASGELENTPTISPKKLTGNDAKLASLCLQLFKLCRLDHTAEMMRLEADFQEVDVATEYGVADGSPVLCSLIGN